jgi:hypothetical protein
LAQRLFALPETHARYLATLKDLLDTVWDEAALLREVDRMEALIGPEIPDDAREAIDDVRRFIEERRAEIEPQLDAGLAGYEFSPREPLCFAEIGRLEGTFDTRFGTLDDHPFFSGTATLEGMIRDEAVTVEAIGSRAGTDPEDPARAQIQIIATLPDGDLRVVGLSVRPGDLRAGTTVAVDWTDRFGFVVRIVPGTDEAWIEGMIGEGTITFEEAGATDEAPVRGHFSGTLIEVPF